MKRSWKIMTSVALSSCLSAATLQANELMLMPALRTDVSLNDTQLIVATGLEDGRYVSREGYFQGMTISDWASQHLLTTNLNYSGYGLPAKVLIEKRSDTHYSGRGTIEAHYNDHSVCTYRILVSIDVTDTGLFIKHIGPSAVPMTAGRCFDAGREQEYIHPMPYVKVVPTP